MSDEEYEIESVLEARVEKKRSRNPKLIWRFRVRWKGYSAADDTWEPIENFTGAEESISHFWERVNTGGRDYRHLEQFQAGEVFIPVGPPKKRKGKQKEKSPTGVVEPEQDPSAAIPPTSAERVSPTDSRKREYDNDEPDAKEPSPKRSRPASNSFNSRPNILLMNVSSPAAIAGVNKQLQDVLPADFKTDSQDIHSTFTRDILPDEEPNKKLTPSTVEHSAVSDVEAVIPTRSRTTASGGSADPGGHSAQTMPLHRARVVNPLVKLLNDHHLASAKIHEAGNESEKSTGSPKAATYLKKRKPGPGRSSDGLLFRTPTLLTAERGKLKSVRGKDRSGIPTGRIYDKAGKEEPLPDLTPQAPTEQDAPIEPPTAGELLQLAGFDPGSATLSDYEDEDKRKPAPSKAVATEAQNNDILSPTVKESLFPSTIPSLESNPVWRRSTIFEPLGMSTDTPSSIIDVEADVSFTPFQLNLDSSTSIPVRLVDVTSSANSSLPSCVLVSRDPPGKFYQGQHAIDLLATLRTRGSFARVRLAPEATDDHSTNFERLMKRLSNDELFVAMVGQDLLVFCSSNNTLFAQRLNVPPNFLSVESILAIHVSIENCSAFADATANADNTLWSQYIVGY